MIGTLLSSYIQRTPQHRGKMTVVRTLLGLFGNAPVRSRYGVRMIADSKDFTNMLSIMGKYDDVHDAVVKIKPGMAFVDIGANAGVFSMIAAKLVGPGGCVVAFEPSMPIYQRLIANSQLNGLKNFFPFCAAVGDATSTCNFAPGESTHTGLGHIDPNGSAIVLQIGGENLLQLLSTLVGGRNVMLKIDVEGAELVVVNALSSFLSRRNVVTAIIEIDYDYLDRFEASANLIYTRMSEAGFRPTVGQSHSRHYNEVFQKI
jgi:FkbM family methyltransferase